MIKCLSLHRKIIVNKNIYKMTSQFSPKVSQILAFSREEAARLASRSVGPEHLLLGILRDKTGPVHELFLKLDINYQSIKTELEQKVREDDFMQPLNTRELVLNEKASNILKLAVLEARIQSMQMVDEQHLLLAILHDHANNGAKEVLEFNNMSYEDALTYFQNKSGYMTMMGLTCLIRMKMRMACLVLMAVIRRNQIRRVLQLVYIEAKEKRQC